MPDLNRNIQNFDPIVAHQGSDTFIAVVGLEGRKTTLDDIADYVQSDWVLANTTGTLDTNSTFSFIDSSTGDPYTIAAPDLADYVLGDGVNSQPTTAVSDSHALAGTTLSGGQPIKVTPASLSEYSVSTGIPNLTNEYTQGNDFLGSEQFGFRIAAGADTGESGYCSAFDIAQYALGKGLNAQTSGLANANHVVAVVDTTNNVGRKLTLANLGDYLFTNVTTALPDVGFIAGAEEIPIRDTGGDANKVTVDAIAEYTYDHLDEQGDATAFTGTEYLLVNQSGQGLRTQLDDISDYFFDTELLAKPTLPFITAADTFPVLDTSIGVPSKLSLGEFTNHIFDTFDTQETISGNTIIGTDYVMVNRSGTGSKASINLVKNFIYDDVNTQEDAGPLDGTEYLLINQASVGTKATVDDVAAYVATTIPPIVQGGRRTTSASTTTISDLKFVVPGLPSFDVVAGNQYKIELTALVNVPTSGVRFDALELGAFDPGVSPFSTRYPQTSMAYDGAGIVQLNSSAVSSDLAILSAASSTVNDTTIQATMYVEADVTGSLAITYRRQVATGTVTLHRIAYTVTEVNL